MFAGSTHINSKAADLLQAIMGRFYSLEPQSPIQGDHTDRGVCFAKSEGHRGVTYSASGDFSALKHFHMHLLSVM